MSISLDCLSEHVEKRIHLNRRIFLQITRLISYCLEPPSLRLNLFRARKFVKSPLKPYGPEENQGLISRVLSKFAHDKGRVR